MSRTRTKVAAATIAVVTGAGATAAAIAATHRNSQGTTAATTTASTRPSGPGHGPGGNGFGADLTAATSYLGVSKTALQMRLEAGKTLAQIASATSGKSTAGLIAALVSAETIRLEAQVKAGKLTQAQETKMVAGLNQRVTDMVNGKRPSGPLRGGGPPPAVPQAYDALLRPVLERRASAASSSARCSMKRARRGHDVTARRASRASSFGIAPSSMIG
jgi:hypothetical protein